MGSEAYEEQVSLLVQTIPVIAQHKCFALKGGTALNLFIQDMPRLSVDIDLVYLPINSREEALYETRSALERICTDIRAGAVPNAEAEVMSNRPDALRALVRRDQIQIKVELSPVLRGTVLPAESREVMPQTSNRFGHAEILVASHVDLYGGKICAALDRQHPRDLFDVKLLLESDGLNRDVLIGFLVYLISHGRPIRELLAPKLVDIRAPFLNQFQGMARENVDLEELEHSRTELLRQLREKVTPADCEFLVGLKKGTPDWSHLPHSHIQDLPAIRWKLQNIRKMKPDAHARAVEALQDVLAKHYGYQGAG